MCTINDTKVTTHIISVVRWSIRKPTSNLMPSATIQVYTLMFCASRPPYICKYST